MGLTAKSTGKGAAEEASVVIRQSPEDRVIALCGNPNVGKSTVFNELTGLKQHTGNWPGKTVGCAQGVHNYRGLDYILVDLPGTYSLMPHSAEEEVARDFVVFGGADAAIVVCDATCLERNLNLVLQTIEIMPHVVVCVNLMDEARKKGIHIDSKALQRLLGVPVVSTSAREGKGLDTLVRRTKEVVDGKTEINPRKIRYLKPIEEAISIVKPVLEAKPELPINPRWLALRLLCDDSLLIENLKHEMQWDLSEDNETQEALKQAQQVLMSSDITSQKLQDQIVSCIVLAAEEVCLEALPATGQCSHERDRKLDKLLTSRRTGFPIMLLMLAVIFWLTITGSNYPSDLLATGLFWVQDRLTDLFQWFGAPDWLHGVFVLGVYRVLAWVVSVMLPPMAIFFPLFTLLEDFGYLPRVAFNLDHQFKKAKACGKQALTMWVRKFRFFFNISPLPINLK